MGKRIAVSDSLSPVKQMLNREGFEVVNLESNADLSQIGMNDYHAVVVSGLDQNMLGMQDISTKAVVINAAGKRPEEVLEELKVRLG